MEMDIHKQCYWNLLYCDYDPVVLWHFGVKALNKCSFLFVSFIMIIIKWTQPCAGTIHTRDDGGTGHRTPFIYSSIFR